jgi:hypothetical protein
VELHVDPAAHPSPGTRGVCFRHVTDPGSHDIPHPIGDPDDDDSGLVEDDEEEEDEEEEDEEPMQFRRQSIAARHFAMQQ